MTLAQAISKVNQSPKWGHSAYFTYGPGGSTYGWAMRILQWFNQNHAPLVDDNFNPQANLAAATDTWLFHNQLAWTSNLDLMIKFSDRGNPTQLFNEGVIALMPGWQNDAQGIQANLNAVAIPFPLPPGGIPASIAIGDDMESAFKSSPHLDLAKLLVEETTTDETAQSFLPEYYGYWLPALKSLLSQYATYDQLDGYQTDVAKAMARVMMQQALEGNDRQIPAWKKNHVDIWTEWNACYGRILGAQAPGLARADIQKELDSLQAYIVASWPERK